MAEWKKYTGSGEQFEELASAKTLVRVRYSYGQEVNWSCTLFRSESNARDTLQDAIAYLICEPHPYANEIKIWADTGCDVWWRMIPENHVGLICRVFKTNSPDWNIPGAEYRLTPFED